jgi:hypothetical protein
MLETPEDAFTLLQLYMEEAIKSAKDKVTRFTNNDDFKTVGKLAEHLQALQTLKTKVETLKGEFTGLIDLSKDTQETRTLTQAIDNRRQIFNENILRVIVELGGKVERRLVMEKLEQKLKAYLTEFDRELLETAKVPRWEKDVDSCVNRLRAAGLISPPEKSGRGVWQITEAGKKELQNFR